MYSIQLFVVFFKHMHITLPSESQVDQTGWQHNLVRMPLIIMVKWLFDMQYYAAPMIYISNITKYMLYVTDKYACLLIILSMTQN